MSRPLVAPVAPAVALREDEKRASLEPVRTADEHRTEGQVDTQAEAADTKDAPQDQPDPTAREADPEEI